MRTGPCEERLEGHRVVDFDGLLEWANIAPSNQHYMCRLTPCWESYVQAVMDSREAGCPLVGRNQQLKGASTGFHAVVAALQVCRVVDVYEIYPSTVPLLFTHYYHSDFRKALHERRQSKHLDHLSSDEVRKATRELLFYAAHGMRTGKRYCAHKEHEMLTWLSEYSHQQLGIAPEAANARQSGEATNQTLIEAEAGDTGKLRIFSQPVQHLLMPLQR
eukprot:scaffold1194_cov369-Prasinococcus_capsulatus_cf.AAC.24